MVKKKVIISACLLGEVCRYDGKTKEVNAVIEAFAAFEIIPFCPEAPLFGTPRERISVVMQGQKKHIITDESKKDVTELLRHEILSFCAAHPNADAIVLKSKSPSCGLATTPLLNAKKEIIALGNGLAADIFLERYPQIVIQDELAF